MTLGMSEANGAMKIAAFVGDPSKAQKLVNRADVADVISTIGLILTSQLDATSKLVDGDNEGARKALDVMGQQMLTLVEDVRDLVGKADDDR